METHYFDDGCDPPHVLLAKQQIATLTEERDGYACDLDHAEAERDTALAGQAAMVDALDALYSIATASTVEGRRDAGQALGLDVDLEAYGGWSLDTVVKVVSNRNADPRAQEMLAVVRAWERMRDEGYNGESIWAYMDRILAEENAKAPPHTG